MIADFDTSSSRAISCNGIPVLVMSLMTRNQSVLNVATTGISHLAKRAHARA
ncbi:hypothetical protein [Klebsiella pneumoniae]|uniref:hypothetical protein n=1 Tax=Klebsiella pneumoniae TaxID=573 RepID=UPI00349F7C1A